MNLKIFSERLHKGLDEIDFPIRSDERIATLSKMLKIPRFKAECLLNGSCAPESPLLNQLAEELEVSTQWLLGENEEK